VKRKREKGRKEGIRKEEKEGGRSTQEQNKLKQSTSEYKAFTLAILVLPPQNTTSLQTHIYSEVYHPEEEAFRLSGLKQLQKKYKITNHSNQNTKMGWMAHAYNCSMREAIKCHWRFEKSQTRKEKDKKKQQIKWL
jgi:hypothetical protein